MRVLCTVWTVPSHLRPLLPVVRALLDAGDEVLVVTTEALADAVGATGAQVAAVLRDPDRRTPGVEPPDLGDPMANALAQVMASARLDEQARAVIELARGFGAELVIRDDSEFSGYLAAEMLGLPVVCLAGAMTNDLDARPLAAAVNLHRSALGLDPLTDPGLLYPGPVLDYLPESLSPARTAPSESLRFRQPLEDEPGAALPGELTSIDSDLPVVFAAIGTGWRTWEAHGTADDPYEAMRTLLGALSDVKCAALVSSGGMDCDDMPRADHVLVSDFVPQGLVLQAARLFCTHGGYNSIREAIRAGVPMLVRPSTLDQPTNAAAVARLGLGSVTTGLDRARLAERITRSLADRALEGRVKAAQRAVLALPGVETAPEALRAVSRRRRRG
ncbi:glycosyltransferase [Pseudonocardia spinosispora]|uniref:glycosyltransferase n=1 Tax=Pseudonocardia spinosispora TaxID=103441 RepID=UPI00040AFEEB|nr:glycosyltransferase [Pseudonocardia spinosispora]